MKIMYFGVPCLATSAGNVVPLACSRPVQLCLRLAESGVWEAREDMAALFWPDSPRRTAQSNLRNLLTKIKTVLPHVYIESTASALRATAFSDLNEFKAAWELQIWEAVIELGKGNFLHSFESTASEPYSQWVRQVRDTKLLQWVHALRQVIMQPSLPFKQREAYANLWSDRCPFDEDAIKERIRLAVEIDEFGAAANIYQAFEAKLRDELGVRPSIGLERVALDAAKRAPPTLQPPLSLWSPKAKPNPNPNPNPVSSLSLMTRAGHPG